MFTYFTFSEKFFHLFNLVTKRYFQFCFTGTHCLSELYRQKKYLREINTIRWDKHVEQSRQHGRRARRFLEKKQESMFSLYECKNILVNRRFMTWWKCLENIPTSRKFTLNVKRTVLFESLLSLYSLLTLWKQKGQGSKKLQFEEKRKKLLVS